MSDSDEETPERLVLGRDPRPLGGLDLSNLPEMTPEQEAYWDGQLEDRLQERERLDREDESRRIEEYSRMREFDDRKARREARAEERGEEGLAATRERNDLAVRNNRMLRDIGDDVSELKSKSHVGFWIQIAILVTALVTLIVTIVRG